ncbi:MAG: hypothetical protein HXX10_25625 [Rhodoplanes sp.]|uniref:hypothetical protein n=1 Tax=Rhodoplanes sp. TaxID=1968906 RepID=UPI00184C6456|nr:hypothetical protein [Rhodoplanes sp.]NVO17422.1 hypothetical protein [Rhodoplanes sp.]
MYYFKGRGFLWHDTKGPVLWWPLNWVWFALFELKRWREDKAAERAERRAARAAGGSAPEAPPPEAGKAGGP